MSDIMDRASREWDGLEPWMSAVCIGAVWPMALVMLAAVVADGLGRDVDEDEDHAPWGED